MLVNGLLFMSMNMVARRYMCVRTCVLVLLLCVHARNMQIGNTQGIGYVCGSAQTRLRLGVRSRLRFGDCVHVCSGIWVDVSCNELICVYMDF